LVGSIERIFNRKGLVMTSFTQPPSSLVLAADRDAIGRMWGWLVGIGIVWMVLGVLALVFVGFSTLVTVVATGILLIVAGIGEVVHSFAAQRWGGMLWHLFLGILTAVAGVMLAINPAAGALALTLVIAAYFFISGLFRVVGSIVQRYPQWGWMVTGGVVSILLGVLIWSQWPISGLWVIGLFVGIDLLINGAALIGEGMAARQLNLAGGARPPREAGRDEGGEAEQRRAA
jgi:uncharacterized membrane protein HdeD (DUF308 family)